MADEPTTATLWHYTCHHRAKLIGRRGVLRPHLHPLLDDIPVVWLTDLAVPDVDGLGLTSTTLRCDRTEVRYRVIEGHAIPWREWRMTLRVDPVTISELTFGRRSRHWFVSTGPVAVVRDA